MNIVCGKETLSKGFFLEKSERRLDVNYVRTMVALGNSDEHSGTLRPCGVFMELLLKQQIA